MANKINPRAILFEGLRLTTDNIQFAAPIMLVSLIMTLLPITYHAITGSNLPDNPGSDITIVMIIINAMLHFGLARIAIETARGNSVSWDLFIMPASVYVQVGVVVLACGMMVSAGILFFVIPGIFLALMWSQVYYLLVDRKAQWFQALPMSQKLTEGNKILLFELFCRLFVISMPLFILALVIVKLSSPDISNLPKDVVPEVIHTPLVDTLNILYAIVGTLIQVFNTFVGGITYQKLLGENKQTDIHALTA